LINLNLLSGVEIDVRIFHGNIVLQHDPFCNGIKLEDWVNDYNLKLLIVNVKEEGLEEGIQKILNNANIDNYFILDETIPFIIKYCSVGFSNFALRVSLWEDINSAIKILHTFERPPNWVWLDTFNGKIPFTSDKLKKLKNLGAKICLVSPELHPDYQFKVPCSNFMKQYYKFDNGFFDAICTKKEFFWNNVLIG